MVTAESYPMRQCRSKHMFLRRQQDIDTLAEIKNQTWADWGMIVDCAESALYFDFHTIVLFKLLTVLERTLNREITSNFL